MARIVSPVMRFIGVADAGRSAAFYGKVLGFEIVIQAGVTEAVRGPARVRFGASGYAADEWERPLPPGSAMVFFETDDLEGWKEEIRSRGGQAGETLKVNGIKMRVFEVRDPDGNVLWFGQSYDEAHTPRDRPMMEKALPELAFEDVGAAVAYYRDVLGFGVNYQQEDLGVMDRDEVTVLLNRREGGPRGTGSVEVYVRDADALYEELLQSGAKTEGAPVSQPWGLRTFSVRDLEGNRITFAQPFE